MRFFCTFAIIYFSAGAAFGLTTYVPENAIEIESVSRRGHVGFPNGPFSVSDQSMEAVSGKITRQSWRINNPLRVETVLSAMTNAYERQGFKSRFRCKSVACGGFAFRYSLELTQAPDFLVDLDNYEYVDLRNEREILTLFITQLDGITYINQLHAQIPKDNKISLVEEGTSLPPVPQNDARWVLGSVHFEVGSSKIAEKDDIEIQKIVDRLSLSNEVAYVVGHSDQTGGLDANLSLSHARAASVRKVLIEEFGVSASRVIAKGVAFLAPIADNATKEGRNLNRRVEVVFLRN